MGAAVPSPGAGAAISQPATMRLDGMRRCIGRNTAQCNGRIGVGPTFTDTPVAAVISQAGAIPMPPAQLVA
jgi:hypothetical protein